MLRVIPTFLVCTIHGAVAPLPERGSIGDPVCRGGPTFELRLV